MKNEKLRNIAIIAHVDHGKTTLVDQLLRQSGVFRANEQVQERVMDSGDLERERGITILSKNTAVNYKGYRINIVDTPGHADFGGEVERILQMVDGVLLLVDAFEGCMPQTRFVLRKALGLGKIPVVVVNKVDRPGARPLEVVDEVMELFIDLGASAEQLDFPVVYASARDGYSGLDPDDLGTDMQPLFDTIISAVPAPGGDDEGPLQVLFSTLDYDDYVGRIGVGRIQSGRIRRNQTAVLCGGAAENPREVKISRLYRFEGLKRVEIEEAGAGEIVAVAGISDLAIGETVCDVDHVDPLPFVKIDEPTLSMMFMVNDSPFAGKEGKYVTSRQIRDRLQRELLKDVALRVEDSATNDSFRVMGRGEMHLSILIETMRREGYELQVSPPHVLTHEENGKTMEPMERVVIDVPETYQGNVMTALGARKAILMNMQMMNNRSRLEFRMPSRGLFGYRSQFLTDTHGEGIMNTIFDGYEEWCGPIATRSSGSLISFDTGDAVTYGLFNAQQRGTLIVTAGEKVYEGEVVGYTPTGEDITVNVCKTKHLTNTRASGSDDALRLIPVTKFSLEGCLEFLAPDELLEVTPENLRIRKRILDHDLRMKAASKKNK